MYPNFPPRYLPSRTRSLPAGAGLGPAGPTHSLTETRVTKASGRSFTETGVDPSSVTATTTTTSGEYSSESSRSTARLENSDESAENTDSLEDFRTSQKQAMLVVGTVVLLLACFTAALVGALRIGGSELQDDVTRPVRRFTRNRSTPVHWAGPGKELFKIRFTSASRIWPSPRGKGKGNLFQMVLSRSRRPPSTVASTGRPWDESTCWSEACLAEGAAIRASTDLALNPCDDFYEYACSRWSHARPLPRGHATSSVDEDLLDVLTLDVFNALTKPSKKPIYEKLRALLLSCAVSSEDTFKTIAKAGLTSLGLERWPYDHDADADAVSISTTIGRMVRDFALDPLFGLTEVFDPASSTGFRIVYALGGPQPILSEGLQDDRDYSFVRRAYDELVDALEGKSLYDPLETELQLVGVVANTSDSLQLTLRNCSRVTADDLPDLDWISWDKLLIEFTGKAEVVSNATEVLLADPLLFQKLAATALLHGRSSKFKMANYLGYRVLLLLSPFAATADEANSPASLAYARHAAYPFSLNEYETCVRFIDRVEPVVALRRLRDERTDVVSKLGDRKEVVRLVHFLRRELAVCLKTSSLFFTSATTDVARRLLAFLSDVTWQVLQPDIAEHTWTFEKLLAAYSQLGASKVGVLNFIRATSQLRRDAMADVLAPRWLGGFLRTTANLDFPFRFLEVPLPVFNFERSSDDTVRHLHIPRVATRVYRAVYRALYVASANLAFENMTWNPVRFFDDSADCLSEQYAGLNWKHGVPSDNATARRSLDDLFDALALGSALDAYEAYVEEFKRTYRLKGLEIYNARQMFFVEYARNLCEISDPKYVKAQLQGRSVSPAWYRVNGPLMNTWEFARAFGCRSGTFMNPTQKCPLIRKHR